MKRIVFYIWALLLVVAPIAHADDLLSICQSGEFWKLSREQLVKQYVAGEKGSWNDAKQQEMILTSPQKLTLGNMTAGEIIIRWDKDSDSINFAQIMVYNKGDNGSLMKDSFVEQTEKAKAIVTQISEVKPQNFRASGSEAAVKMRVWTWDTPHAFYALEVDYSGTGKNFEAEFIRVKVMKNKDEYEASMSGGQAKALNLKANVKKTGSCVEIINVPMVDQGQKGYCAVATASRVFSYYGLENIDQHQLASLADSSGEEGTNPKVMYENLKKISSKFGLKTKETYDPLKNPAKYFKEYNSIAKKEKQPQIDLKSLSSIDQGFKPMNADIARKAYGSEKDVEKWMKLIRPYIDAGVPVCWGVMLGLVPEPQEIGQTSGGHMRLIIGYDDVKKTIIFTDSWGMAHARKEISMQDALTMTTRLGIIMPR